MSDQVSVLLPELLLLLFTKHSSHEIVHVLRLVCKSLQYDMEALHKYITNSTIEVLIKDITSQHDEFTLRVCMALKRFDIFLNYSTYDDVVYGCGLKGVNSSKYIEALKEHKCEGLIDDSLFEVREMHDLYRRRSFEQVCTQQICCDWKVYEIILEDDHLENSKFEYQPQLLEWLAGKHSLAICIPRNMILVAKRGMIKTYMWCERQRRRFNATHRKGDPDRHKRNKSLKGIAKQAIIWTIRHNYPEFTQYLEETYGFADDKNSPFYKNLLRLKERVNNKNMEPLQKRVN